MNQKSLFPFLFTAAVAVAFFYFIILPLAASIWPPSDGPAATHSQTQAINKNRRDALADHPGIPESQALKLGHKAKASKLMESTSEANKKPIAAANFLVFYYSRAMVLPEICQSEGVDIGSYVQVFMQENGDTLRIAQKVVAESNSPKTPEQIQATLAANKPLIVPPLTHQLRDVAASQNKTSVLDGCRYVADHGQTLARGQIYSTIQPSLYRALTSQ